MRTVIIFSFIFLFTSFVAQAQSQSKDRSDSVVKRYSRIVTFGQMDQRKIYHWANGQRSTATGRNAGEHLPDYVKLIGDDSAVVVQGPKGKPLNR